MIARRGFVTALGGLVVGFAVPLTRTRAGAQVVGTDVPVLPPNAVDSWLAVAADGTVTVKFGKVELGTGIATAIAQIVADELDVPVDRIAVSDADTADTPDQGYTAGSASLSSGAIPVRKAAAEARRAIVELAATQLGVAADRLITHNGVVSVNDDPSRRVTYGALVAGRALHRTVPPNAAVKSPDRYAVVGTSTPRVDLPGKVFGSFHYLQNLRVPGMLHGRVIRPTAVGATLAAVDDSALHDIPGARLVRQGAFLGVVAPTEWTAIQAMGRIRATWTGGGLPPVTNLADAVRATPALEVKPVVDRGDLTHLDTGALSAQYSWPYQTHGSIGPSCAVADVRDGRARIWSSTQGVYPLRGALAQLLGLPTTAVRVTFVEGAGCYGHNGADDAAADAALLSQVTGKPVRVQWTRQQEHGWDPKNPAMAATLTAALDAQTGKIAAWRTDIWSPSHSTRPAGEAGNLLAGLLTGSPKAKIAFTGGDRDAKIDYDVANYRVTMHNLAGGILRSPAMRGLGGTQNTFFNESFMDELAHAAGADPLDFRMRHMSGDERALDVLRAVAKLAAWQPATGSAAAAGTRQVRGRGLAFVHYENTEAYVAAVADVLVDRTDGTVRVEHLAISHDCGLIVNPDGLRNQIEGNAIQALSRGLKEAVTFDTSTVTSVDWRGYPILRFNELPTIAIALIDRPNLPIFGAGEATTTVIAPAVGNAIFAATGARLRTVPFTPDRVLAAVRGA